MSEQETSPRKYRGASRYLDKDTEAWRMGEREYANEQRRRALEQGMRNIPKAGDLIKLYVNMPREMSKYDRKNPKFVDAAGNCRTILVTGVRIHNNDMFSSQSHVCFSYKLGKDGTGKTYISRGIECVRQFVVGHITYEKVGHVQFATKEELNAYWDES